MAEQVGRFQTNLLALVLEVNRVQSLYNTLFGAEPDSFVRWGPNLTKKSVDEGKEATNTTLSGSLSAGQQKAI